MNHCGTATGHFDKNQRLQNEKHLKTPNAPFQTNLQFTGELTSFIPPSAPYGIFLKINQGKMAPITGITGTATTSGKGGSSRPIEATATPADINHGNLKLWFMAGDRKMIFEPAYHFAGKKTTAVLAQAIGIQP